MYSKCQNEEEVFLDNLDVHIKTPDMLRSAGQNQNIDVRTFKA